MARVSNLTCLLWHRDKNKTQILPTDRTELRCFTVETIGNRKNALYRFLTANEDRYGVLVPLVLPNHVLFILLVRFIYSFY
jgi:hypothetical protein